MQVDRALGARTLRRRTLLGGALAGLATGTVLASSGCSRSPASIASLTAEHPFYIAHRGGGNNWPEMTGYAYAQATKIPALRAIEVSVCISSDGVLVCSHDPSTLRATGVDLQIAEQPWEVLSQLQVTAATTSDPRQPARPLTRFDEILNRYIDQYVIFVEPKVPEAAEALIAALIAARAPERIVWKQYVTSPHWDRVKQLGFGTWGYLLNQPSHIDNVHRWAAHPSIDMLGAGIAETDGFINRVVKAARQEDKLTISWPIANADQRSRALSLGVNGMMTSNVVRLLRDNPL